MLFANAKELLDDLERRYRMLCKVDSKFCLSYLIDALNTLQIYLVYNNKQVSASQLDRLPLHLDAFNSEMKLYSDWTVSRKQNAETARNGQGEIDFFRIRFTRFFQRLKFAYETWHGTNSHRSKEKVDCAFDVLEQICITVDGSVDVAREGGDANYAVFAITPHRRLEEEELRSRPHDAAAGHKRSRPHDAAAGHKRSRPHDAAAGHKRGCTSADPIVLETSDDEEVRDGPVEAGRMEYEDFIREQNEQDKNTTTFSEMYE
jgi:hypothetical protein